MRVMFYDKTARENGLAFSWFAGGLLYKAVRNIDICRGVESWEEAFNWLAAVEPEENINQIQFWGHGRWGLAFINSQAFGVKDLKNDSAYFTKLNEIKTRLHSGSTIWFRTCSTFGCAPGQRFAKEVSNFFECKVAGHTYIIGPLQSGLHSIQPNSEPHWSVDEGLKKGTPQKPISCKTSFPFAPNTISCLRGKIPYGW